MATLRFFKPYGVLTKFTDSEGRPTLADYVTVSGVYAAGRLDMDSEGLLLLTDDNALKHQLEDPRYEHPRTYWVQVEGQPESAALQALTQGVLIGGYRTKPARAELLETRPDLPLRSPPVTPHRDRNSTWLALTLTEGKNRQVRRMTAAVGHPTLRLVRVKIGPIGLEGLAVGEWQNLTAAEEKTLRMGLKNRRRKSNP